MTDPAALRRFLTCLLEEGVNAIPDGRFYTSAAHREADIDESIRAATRALERMNAQ